MNKKLLLTVAMISAGTMLCAAPDRKPKAPEKPEKYEKPEKPSKPAPLPPPKPVVVKPAPLPPPKPVVVKPAPLLPPAPPVVTYSPVRNTYTIQLNADNAILFEQRLVGMQELRDKIRMVKYDRPRPLIRIRVADGVDSARLNFALAELKNAGFHDVEIIHLGRRAKAVHVKKPAKRMKR